MIEITTGSDNIFADIGLPESDERMAKARIALHIARLIKQEGLTQMEAARRIGLTQPNVSDLLRGKLKGFSLERLIQCLNALDQDVEIVIRTKPADADRGHLVVGSGI